MNDDVLTQIQALQREWRERDVAWLQQIISIATAALAILVAFAPQEGLSTPARYMLAGAWLSLGLGIVAGVASIYGYTHEAKARLENVVEEWIQALAEGRAPEMVVTVPARIFAICRWVMVLSLLLSVCLLVGHAMWRTLAG